MRRCRSIGLNAALLLSPNVAACQLLFGFVEPNGPVDAGSVDSSVDASVLDASRDAALSDDAGGAFDSGEGGDSGCASEGADGGEPRSWRYLFVTSSEFDGDLRSAIEGISDDPLVVADTVCQQAADAGTASLAGLTWRAWLSTSTLDARRRIGADAGALPYELRLADGCTVAFDAGVELGFDANPRSHVLNEHGIDTGSNVVWTGTDAHGGRTAHHCEDWTTRGVEANGAIGSTDAEDFGRWTNSATSTQSCNLAAHLYCFEER